MRNNTLKISAICLIAASLFASCEKFLDLNPLYTQDAENYFETPVDYGYLVV